MLGDSLTMTCAKIESRTATNSGTFIGDVGKDVRAISGFILLDIPKQKMLLLMQLKLIQLGYALI